MGVSRNTSILCSALLWAAADAACRGDGGPSGSPSGTGTADGTGDAGTTPGTSHGSGPTAGGTAPASTGAATGTGGGSGGTAASGGHPDAGGDGGGILDECAALTAPPHPGPFDGATWYASPDGTGDGATQASPKSLAALLEQDVEDGDTIVLLPGVYPKTERTAPRPGTVGRIKIIGSVPPFDSVDLEAGLVVGRRPAAQVAVFDRDLILRDYAEVHVEAVRFELWGLWLDRAERVLVRGIESRSPASTGVLLTKVQNGLVEESYFWDDMPAEDSAIEAGHNDLQRSDYAIRVHNSPGTGDIVLRFNLIEGTPNSEGWTNPNNGVTPAYFAYNQPISFKEGTASGFVLCNHLVRMNFSGIYLGQEADKENKDRTVGEVLVYGNVLRDWGSGGRSVVAANVGHAILQKNRWEGDGGTHVLWTQFATPNDSTAVVGPLHPERVDVLENTVTGSWNAALLKSRLTLGDTVYTENNTGNVVQATFEALDWGIPGKQTEDPPNLVVGPNGNWIP